ncbi:MAG: O-antigen ligase family protein [Bacteroidota bacterium]
MNPLSASIHPWIIRLFCTYVFILPFSSWMASLVLAFLFVLCLIYKISEKKFLRFSSFVMLWLILFYLLHVTGLLYTENYSYAGLDLQIKLSFLLMPLLIDQIPLPASAFRRLTRSFIAGCTLFSLILLVNAVMEYYIWHNGSSFFYTDFCSLQHVAYLTLYINCALFFLADEFFRLPGYRLRNRYLLVLWMIFLVIIITLLASRTAQMAALVSVSLYLFLLRRKTSRFASSLTFSGITAVAMILIFLLISGNRNRFDNPVSQPVPITNNIDVNESSTIQHNVRFEVWKNTLEVYRQHPVLGVGTGDIKDALNRQYELAGFREGLEFNLSPHNQFLHTLLVLGIPGIITLLLIFGLAARNAVIHHNLLIPVLLIAVFINCMTEGILEKQAGVLFFTFFLIVLTGQKEEINSQQKAEA